MSDLKFTDACGSWLLCVRKRRKRRKRRKWTSKFPASKYTKTPSRRLQAFFWRITTLAHFEKQKRKLKEKTKTSMHIQAIKDDKKLLKACADHHHSTSVASKDLAPFSTFFRSSGFPFFTLQSTLIQTHHRQHTWQQCLHTRQPLMKGQCLIQINPNADSDSVVQITFAFVPSVSNVTVIKCIKASQ